MREAEMLLQAAWTAAIVVAVVFAVGIGVGFWLLARRSSRPTRPSVRQPDLQRANILLVRLDDAVAAADDELGFAIAQFGSNAAGDFAKAITTARHGLAKAFALKQKLDDATPESAAQKRDWTAQIIHLCQSAQASLTGEQEHFDRLGRRGKDAPAAVRRVRQQLKSLTEQRQAAADVMRELKAAYSAGAIASVADSLQRADAAITLVTKSLERAESTLDDNSTTVTLDALDAATEQAHNAERLLDAVDALADELGKAQTMMESLVASTRSSLDGARTVRDNPSDADTGAAVGAAIAATEQSLKSLDAGDPIRALDQLRDANAALDISLASARNQEQRLDGARTALTGALVVARSQLSVTAEFIAGRRRSVGAEARTRLAEAERLLTLAEVEADPVLALDTARSSAMYSRDADALARYDVR